MTLVQLEYIVALATHGSFVAAAEKCFVTQPTLSMQIQKMEESLGVKLFDRSRQPIIPTEIGDKVVAQARVILRERNRLKDIVEDDADRLSAELKIGVIPTVAPYLMPNLIQAFLEKYPGTKLKIWENTTENIVNDLKLGILDCGILSTPLHDQGIVEWSLYYETFVAYVSEKSPIYVHKLLDHANISEDKIWLLNEGHCMRGQVLSICKYQQANEDTALEYNTGSVETLKRMVDLKGGVTILPELAIRDYDEDQLHRIRYFKSPEPVREISLVMANKYGKRSTINKLGKEILSIVPEKFTTPKRKEVMTF